jgi:quercetin dioxygenase-like cupin family protein
MEIRRFGFGHRRPDGPAGTRGVEAAPVHADSRGAIAELALRPNAVMAPHSNPNLCYLLVIEGGGFVQVGEERARVAAGEAVVWPPNVIHGAWTELTPMRAIVVEFAGGGAVEAEKLLLGASAVSDVVAVEPTAVPAPTAGSARPGVLPPDRNPNGTEGEPW